MTRMNLKEKLTIKCPCPEAWSKGNRDKQGFSTAELGYIRCDYDGYGWQAKVCPVHKELEDNALVDEFNSVLEAFRETFPALTDLRRYCRKSLPTSNDPVVYDVYLDLNGPGYYWIRIRLIPHDYNLYLHCISKKALTANDNKIQ